MKKNFKYIVKGDSYFHVSHSLPGEYLTAGEMKDGVIVNRPKLVTHCSIVLVPDIQIFKSPFYKGVNLSWLIFHLTFSRKVKQVSNENL